MLEHKPGTLYADEGARDYYLAVVTHDNKPQLINAPGYNLKGLDTRILLFNQNTPNIYEKYNPLMETTMSEVGSVDATTVKPVDERVLEVMMNMDPRRSAVEAILNIATPNEKIIVVLPLNFEQKYKLG
jgi:hypothetical protein